MVAVVGNDARWNAEHHHRLVQALGAHGEHVERSDDLGPALARAVASGRPACVNVLIDSAAAPAFARGATH